MPLDELAALIATPLAGSVGGVPGSGTVRVPQGEIDVRRNRDADSSRASTFPDGFLGFRYTLELYPSPTVDLDGRVATVSKLLNFVWSQGIPAVAACDYEDHLPNGGGYNRRSVPWPAVTNGAGNGEPSPPPDASQADRPAVTDP